MTTPMPSFAEGDLLYARDLQTMSDALSPLTGMPRGQLLNGISIGGLQFISGIRESIYNIQVYNDSGEEIPAYAVMRQTGLDPTRLVLRVAKPNIYGSQYSHLINGPQPIPISDFGLATNAFPVDALYDDADGTPVFGEMWGPRSGSWKLKKNTGGFLICGVSDSANKLASVMREPFLRFRGTATANIAADATGTVNIFYRSGSTAYTDTTVDMTGVLNDLDDTVVSGAACEVVYDPYGSTVAWRITQADCP